MLTNYSVTIDNCPFYKMYSQIKEKNKIPGEFMRMKLVNMIKCGL